MRLIRAVNKSAIQARFLRLTIQVSQGWPAFMCKRSKRDPGSGSGGVRCQAGGGGGEEQLKLGGLDLLTLASEQAADQVVELGLEKGVFRVRGHDLTILEGDGLVGRFDAKGKAGSEPTTRFIILYRKKNSISFIPRAHLRSAQIDAFEQELQGLRGEGQSGGSRLGCGRQ